jgi:peptidoglycan/xylan/chitin deacetylase (PgdA/CDA1 family)
MIGANILNNPTLFSRAFQELHSDIAVHTWSHRYMTTLSNAEVVAEFGWTMEIIKNSTVGVLAVSFSDQCHTTSYPRIFPGWQTAEVLATPIR